MKHVLLSLSPSGTTAQVMKTIVEQLPGRGEAVIDLPLNDPQSFPTICHKIARLAAPFCLWVGSPVYVDHALPMILSTIKTLCPETPAYAAAIVTYGGVTSGVALYELIESLAERNFVPLGGMKVLCQHSSFRTTHAPMAAGHPNVGDLDIVAQFTQRILAKLAGNPQPVGREAYDYQTEKMKAVACHVNLEKIKKLGRLPGADSSLCNLCGQCVSLCPIQAISLSPVPTRNAECIRCLRCVHFCPQQAFPFEFAAHEEMIRGMAQKSDEKAETAFYV